MTGQKRLGQKLKGLNSMTKQEEIQYFPNLDKMISETKRDIQSGRYRTYVRLEDFLNLSRFKQLKRRKNLDRSR